MNLVGKRALVTGGAKRIGAYFVELLSSCGAELIIHYNSAKDEAELLAERLGAQTLQADLANEKDWEKFRDLKLDILVNNASVYFPGEVDAEKRRLNSLVNFVAPRRLMNFAVCANPAGGVVVNILDQAVLIMASPTPPDSYLQSKIQLAGATYLDALEYAPNWRINAIAPGAVLPPSFLPDSKMELEISRTPLKRKVELSELGDALLFLLCNDSMTGAIIPVDGGRHLAESPLFE